MSSEITRLVSDLEQCRQDLTASQERVTVARRENDRLRSAMNDIRSETGRLLSDETSRRVSAENQISQMRNEVEREKRMRKEAESQAENAAHEQRRHVEFLGDSRKQFETRLTQLVAQLRQREEQVHTLEYQVRDRDRERQRADALEKIVASREASLTTLSAELIQIRKEYMELNASQTAQSHALQLAHKQIEDFREQVTTLMMINNNNNNNSPSAVSNASPPHQPPPIASADEDPHVQEIARLVAFSRDWVKETSKDFSSLHNDTDHLVQLIEDTFVILDKGSVNAGLDLANADRKRGSRMRELESSHLHEQMMKLEGILPSTTVIRNGLDDVRFQISRIGTTVQGAVDAVRSIRNLADKFCGQVGVPQIQLKLERLIQQQQQIQPAPLPTPQYQQFVDRQNQQQQQMISNNNLKNNTINGSKLLPNNNNSNAMMPSSSSNPNSQADTPRGENGSGETLVATSSSTQPTSPNVGLANNSNNNNNFPQQQQQQHQGPVVALDDFIALQQKLSQMDVSSNTTRVKLDGEIMQLKMQIQIEKDRAISEKAKAEFEVERKFAEERRDLQRKIDEGEMKCTNLLRGHENDLRKMEHEKSRAVDQTRTELLEETRQIRDECKSLERSNREAEDIIRELQDQVADHKTRKKELSHECARLAEELRKEAHVSAKLETEMHAARETVVELADELEIARKKISDLIEENNETSMMMMSTNNNSSQSGHNNNNNNQNRQEPSDERNLWAEWQKNLTQHNNSNSNNNVSAARIQQRPATSGTNGSSGGGGVLNRISSQANKVNNNNMPPLAAASSSTTKRSGSANRQSSQPRFEKVQRL